MPHELRGLTEQSPEFYTQLAVAGLVLFVVVVAFAYYLHRKHAHLLKPAPREFAGELCLASDENEAARLIRDQRGRMRTSADHRPSGPHCKGQFM